MGQGRATTARIRRFRRLAIAAALAVAAFAGALALRRADLDRRFLLTGSARWIWYSREIPEPVPLRFRAWKEFSLPGTLPSSAPLLLFGDREWALAVNGAPVARGEQKPGDPLAALDVARFLRPGENRISIEAGSPTGAGGILVRLDLPGGRTLVSDESWRVERSTPPGEGERGAIAWGRPPMYPWRYPEPPPRDQGPGTRD